MSLLFYLKTPSSTLYRYAVPTRLARYVCVHNTDAPLNNTRHRPRGCLNEPTNESFPSPGDNMAPSHLHHLTRMLTYPSFNPYLPDDLSGVTPSLP